MRNEPPFMSRHRILAYATAVAVVAASTGIRLLLDPVLGDNGPYLLMIPGVLAVALACGFGPGVLTSILAAISSAYFWVEPPLLSLVSNDELVQGIAEIVVGTAVSALSHFMQKARQAERNTNLAKDRFLAMLSHELRQPLAPIAAAVDEIEQRIGPASREEVAVIRRHLALHSRLIEDLMDANRIGAGKLHLRLAPTRPDSIVARAVEACLPDIQAKSLRLEIGALPQAEIMGDSIRLQQVFWNLLRNATKFTPERGLISITGDMEHDRIRITVRDSGIGIPPEKLQSLFRAFEQPHGDLSTKLGGLGLGLAICKGVVQMHGGEVHASSGGPGKGAAFSVVLPTYHGSPVAAPAPAIPSPVAVPSRDRPPRVLLVDDQPDTLRLLAQLLRRAGYEVMTATGLESALTAAKNRPDVLVSDMQLPDGTGTELLAALCQQAPVKSICVSGFGAEQEVEQALRSGFRRHLTKPVSFAQLQQALNEVLSDNA